MSHHENEEAKNPLLQAVGWFFLVLVPFSLIVMLGFLGAAFLQGSGYKAPPPPLASADSVEPGPAATQPPAAPSPDAGQGGASDQGDTATAETGKELASTAPSPEQMSLGKTTYMMCAACHGPDGQGVGVEPAKMAPTLTGSELLLGNDEAAIASVLKGIEKKPTSPYMGQMLGLGAALDDEKVAAVLTYVRNSFGNQGEPVSPDGVAEVREKYAPVNAPLGLPREDLMKVAGEG